MYGFVRLLRSFFVALCVAIIPISVAQAADPLPSWRDGPAKAAIVDFVNRVTTASGPDFVAPEERIATFDNDGTLWSEQPLYFQLRYALDRVKALAPEHPEWNDQEPFKSVLADDMSGVLTTGKKGLLQIIAATHAGMTEAEFRDTVLTWLNTARHPRFGQPYNALIYQPMLEVLAYLRANGFKSYITSGGGIAFMRPWAPQAYGISPEQIIGSSIKTKLEMRDGKPVLVRLPEIDFIDNKAEKPVGINKFIGRRPIAAFGNSDGDLQMLQWTTAGEGERFGLIVHHTDAERKWAYDRKSGIGRLDKALDEAKAKGWTVVDMKRDWKTVFSFEKK